MNDTDLVWHTEQRKISDLVPFVGNPRELTEKQAQDLEASLRRFNLVEIPAVNVNQRILAGHQRLKIMQILGRGGEVIDVRMPNRELTEEEEREYLLRSNKNTGQWNDDELANWDEDLLLKVGWTKEELAKMFDLDAGAEEDDVPEPPVEARTKKGQIFTLGTHRVMCGDSTSGADVALLMDGKKADMVFTDPPYGVSYNKKNEWLNSIGKANACPDAIASDEKTVKELQESLIYPAFCQIKKILSERGTYYITSPQGGELLMMMMMMQKAEIPLRHMLIWVKNNHVLGRTDYNYKHEPILFGWIDRHDFYGNGDYRFSVWDIDKPHSSKLHPTMKPVALIVNALKNSTLQDMICADLFLGSGSTLIACEQTSRICYGMEIDERYVDVIIERFCKLTGSDKEKIYAEAEGII